MGFKRNYAKNDGMDLGSGYSIKTIIEDLMKKTSGVAMNVGKLLVITQHLNIKH